MNLKLCAAIVFPLVSATMALPQAKTPPETRNAALRYWMAFAEMQDPPADKAAQDLLEKTAAGEAAWDEKKLGPILDANGAAIRIMQRATKLPDCDWGLEYDEGPRVSIAYAPRARALARLNTLEGMREMANGNSQVAVETWLAGIRFSKHLANGGSLIFALIAKSMLLPNLRALAAAAKQGHLTDSQKKQVSAALRPMREDGFNWGAAWGFEESGGEQFLRELESAKDPGTIYEKLVGRPMPTGAKAPTSEDVRHYREYMKAVQDALNMTPQTAKVQLSALEPQRRALLELAQSTIPNAQKANEARAEVSAARSELLEALSVK